MSKFNRTRNQSTNDSLGPILRPKCAANYVGLSLSSMYKLIQDQKFPRLVKINPGGRASGIPKAWLDDFIRSRVDSTQSGKTSHDLSR